jgi:hypothetical protein
VTQIAYIPPEQVADQRRAALIRDHPELQGEDLIAALQQIDANLTGEYREVQDDEPTGTLHVWVDDAPHDTTDPAGHFEPYDGDTAEYRPTVGSPVDPTVIEKTGGAAMAPDAGGQQ